MVAQMVAQIRLVPALSSGVVMAAIALVLGGCSATGSSNIKSAGLYGVTTVNSQSGQATCSTTVTVGGPTGTYVDLSSGDQLFCNGVQMSKVTNPLNQISYVANVPSVELGHYEVKLERQGETLLADVNLPTAFRNPQILGGSAHAIGQTFVVLWDKDTQNPSSVSASLTLNNQKQDHSKVAASSVAGTDVGALTFGPSDTTITVPDDKTQAQTVVPGPYTGHVTLTRSESGTLTGAWQGTASAAQSVDLNVTLQ